jgi:hypothetical protein
VAFEHRLDVVRADAEEVGDLLVLAALGAEAACFLAAEAPGHLDEKGHALAEDLDDHRAFLGGEDLLPRVPLASQRLDLVGSRPHVTHPLLVGVEGSDERLQGLDGRVRLCHIPRLRVRDGRS